MNFKVVGSHFSVLFFSGVNMKVSIQTSGPASVTVLPEKEGKVQFLLLLPLCIIIQNLMCSPAVRCIQGNLRRALGVRLTRPEVHGGGTSC